MRNPIRRLKPIERPAEEASFTVMGDELEPVCIIHFEGKEGVLMKLAQGSLSKIIERRKQWLNLSSSSYTAFTEVAKKSFEYISDSENLNINDIAQICSYHPACYRNFTDITKIERATKTLTKNASKKRSAESSTETDETKSDNPKPKKVPRNTRQSFEKLSGQLSRSPYVLPEICLICKRNGPIYFFDKVRVNQFHLFLFNR